MKILHLVKTSHGADWALLQMSELVGMGFEIHVALPQGGPRIAEYEAAGIKVHYLDYSLRHAVSSIRGLRRIVQEVDPDVIHSHFVICTLLMRIGLRGDKRPRVFQVPGPLHLEHWFFRNVEIRLAAKNDYWIGSCLWTNERYQRSGIAKERLFLSYYGAEMEQPWTGSREEVLAEFGLAPDAIVMGMVSYIYPPKKFVGQKRGLKGHEDFIDAIAKVAATNPKVYGMCVGGASPGGEAYEQAVRQYAAATAGDHVIFTGTRHDVARLYACFTGAVQPSHSENVGGAVKPMIFRVPVIATRVGGLPDVVWHQRTGLLVPPKNPDALAQAMEEIISDRHDNARMVEEANKLIREVFDFRNTARSVADAYVKVTSSR